jgi:DNA-binding transcriptional ArsR family regulator
LASRDTTTCCDSKSKVFKALSHPTRLWMVEQLGAGERCVCWFVEQVDADYSTISKHLSVLKKAGVVRDEKRGKWAYYQLAMPCVLDMIRCIEDAQCVGEAGNE